MLEMTVTDPILLSIAAFICGIVISFISYKFLKTSRDMIITLILLPVVVCVALLTINGSLGSGIAILGVFGLVRFRSLPGKSTDIVAVFYAMVAGLMMSTGQILLAAVITLVIGILVILSTFMTRLAKEKSTISIVVPEDQEDLDIFNKIMQKYSTGYELKKSKNNEYGYYV